MYLNIFAVLLISICLTISSTAQGPGELDLTFGVAGKKFIPLGTANAFGRSIVVQPDGKLVIASISNNGTDTDFSVIRLTANGELDPGFSDDGHVSTDFDAGSDIAQSVALDASNRIVVAGYTFNGSGFDFGAVRYLDDGSQDESFGDSGKIRIPIGTTAFAKSIAIQSDHKILISGYAINPLSGRNEFTVIRIHENGMMDNSFGEGGIAMTDFSIGSAVANAMTLQQDGKIILAGQVFNETTFLWEIGIARYMPDGTLDPAWDEDGIAHTSSPLINHTINSVAIDNDDRIIVGGYSGTAPSNNLFTIARYHHNGRLDDAFGEDGMLIESFGFQDNQITSMVIQPDGKILAGGYTLLGNANRFAIARIDQTGNFDAGFGQNGITLEAAGENDGIETMALQSDGKLVVAGESFDGNRFSVAVARFDTGIITYVDPQVKYAPLNVYPNPAKAGMDIFIELPQEDFKAFNLYDATGRFIDHLSINNLHAIRLPEGLAPGVYYLNSVVEDRILGQTLFIQ